MVWGGCRGRRACGGQDWSVTEVCAPGAAWERSRWIPKAEMDP